MLIRLFADVSGKDDLPVRACAGFVANEARWGRFEAAWKQALIEAEVSQFHSTDFYACHGEFEGWDRKSPKHRRFSKRFCSVAEKYVYAGFVHGIEVDAFQRLLAPRLRGLKSTPNQQFTSLMLCCTYMLQDAAQTLAATGHASRSIAALFEREDGLGQAIGYYQNMKKLGMPWTDPYVSVDVGDKSFLPLQAADLLAHLSFQHLKRLLKHRGPGPSPGLAPPLQRMCRNRKMKIQLLKEQHITPMLPVLEQYLAEGKIV